MKIKTVLFILLIGFITPVVADDFDDDFDEAVKAYNSGDYAMALKIYHSLAEQGHVDAQQNLGIIYYLGEGALQDYAVAYMWLNMAAASGDKLSIEVRNSIAATMSPTAISEGQRMARECVAKKYKNC